MTYTPPPDYSWVQQVQQASPQLPQDAALYPTERTAEQLAAIQRHVGTLAVGNETGWTNQPRK